MLRKTKLLRQVSSISVPHTIIIHSVKKLGGSVAWRRTDTGIEFREPVTGQVVILYEKARIITAATYYPYEGNS